MVYTTQSVKVSKTGIQVGYTDSSGAVSTQNISFENKTLTLENGLTISAGNASMAGDLAVSGGANIGGVLHAEGAATMASTLAVTGAVSAASTLAVAGNTNLASALNVSGASHLVGALTQDGAASFGSTVAVAGNANLASGLNVSGASHLVGALTQDGAASFGSTVNVTGASHLASTLQVDGATTLGNTLTVTGAATLNSGVTVNGTSATNGAMTVSGAGSIGGALNVSGASTLGSTLDVTGVTSLGSTLAVSGASHLIGATTVDGAVSMGSTLAVSGASHLVGALTQDGAASFGSTVDVTGASHLASTLLVDGAASLGSTLAVSGASHLSSTLLVDGASHLVGALTQDGAASFGSTLNVSGASSLGSTLAVSGNANLASQLNVTGAAALSSTLAVTGAASMASTLAVTGATTLGSSLGVTGAATFQNNVTVNGNLTVLGNQTAIDTTSLQVKDAAILLADGNMTDAVAIGVQMQYKPSGASDVKYAGLKRVSETGEFIFFKDAAKMFDAPAPPPPSPTFPIIYPNTGPNAKMFIGDDGDGSLVWRSGGGQYDGAANLQEAIAYVKSVAPNAIAAVWSGSPTVGGGRINWYGAGASGILQVANGQSWVAIQFVPGFTGEVLTSSSDSGYTNQPIAGEWVQIEMSAPIVLTSYKVGSRGGVPLRSMSSHKLVGSNDKVTWTLVDSQVNVDYSATPVHTFSIPSNTSSFSTYRLIGLALQNGVDSGDWDMNNFVLFNNDTQYPPTAMSSNTQTISGVTYTLSVSSGHSRAFSFINGWGTDGLYTSMTATDASFLSFQGISYPTNGSPYTGSTTTNVAVLSHPTDIYATVVADSFTSASDARLKKDIVPLESALEKMDKIRGVTYHWIDENQPQDLQVGVIAQEIQSVYPQLVRQGGNGFLSVDYPKLTAVLIQSMKELKAIVYELVAERNASKVSQ